jgi:hypothetical protein
LENLGDDVESSGQGCMNCGYARVAVDYSRENYILQIDSETELRSLKAEITDEIKVLEYVLEAVSLRMLMDCVIDILVAYAGHYGPISHSVHLRGEGATAMS